MDASEVWGILVQLFKSELLMLFNIGLRAPHGGVFVIWFVEGNAMMYVTAILVGSIVTVLVLGMLKKPIDK